MTSNTVQLGVKCIRTSRIVVQNTVAPLLAVGRNLIVDKPIRQLELESRYLEQNLQPISTHKRRRRIGGRASNRPNDRGSERYLAIVGYVDYI